MVLAHKNFEQIKMLIDQISDEQTDIFIHIDKKNDALYQQLQSETHKNNNVFIIEDRVSVNWSGFSQIDATLNLIKKVVRINRDYDYVSLISGQCFPIKSNDYIRDFLTENKGKEFIEYMDITNNEKYLYRLKIYNFFREHKHIRKLYMRIIDNILRRIQKPIIKRKNFKNMRLYRGSQWFTITFDCLKYVLNYIEENPFILEDFKYTLVPDEHFFQIIIMNSPYSSRVINNNMRYIDWENQKNSPKTLTNEDLDKLIYSSDIIARKFDLDVDRNLLTNLIPFLNSRR